MVGKLLKIVLQTTHVQFANLSLKKSLLRNTVNYNCAVLLRVGEVGP